MRESKLFHTKLPLFKWELAEDGRVSFSASYAKILRGGNSPVEALFAKIMIQAKLVMALFDRGCSVNLSSDTFYQQLGEPSQMRVWKRIKVASIKKMPVKRSTANQVQLQKFTTEITVEFLLTKIEITPCFLVRDFLYSFDMLYLRKTNSFAEKLGKYCNCPYHNEVIRISF